MRQEAGPLRSSSWVRGPAGYQPYGPVDAPWRHPSVCALPVEPGGARERGEPSWRTDRVRGRGLHDLAQDGPGRRRLLPLRSGCDIVPSSRYVCLGVPTALWAPSSTGPSLGKPAAIGPQHWRSALHLAAAGVGVSVYLAHTTSMLRRPRHLRLLLISDRAHGQAIFGSVLWWRTGRPAGAGARQSARWWPAASQWRCPFGAASIFGDAVGTASGSEAALAPPPAPRMARSCTALFARCPRR